MLGVWGRRVLVVTVEVDISVCLAALFPMTIGLTEEVFLKLHFISLMQSLRSIISPKKTSRNWVANAIIILSFHSPSTRMPFTVYCYGCSTAAAGMYQQLLKIALKNELRFYLPIFFFFYFHLNLNWIELSWVSC